MRLATLGIAGSRSRFRAWSFLLLVALAACAPAAEAPDVRDARAVAAVANAWSSVLVAQYRRDGLDAIARANTRAEAEGLLVEVEARWAPIWRAYEALRAAYTASTRDARSAAEVRRAWCRLAEVAEPRLPRCVP